MKFRPEMKLQHQLNSAHVPQATRGSHVKTVLLAIHVHHKDFILAFANPVSAMVTHHLVIQTLEFALIADTTQLVITARPVHKDMQEML